MNLEPILSHYNENDLIQVLFYVHGTRDMVYRLGRIKEITTTHLLLIPHGDPQIEKAYGGDIFGKFTALDAVHIVEIISLSEDPGLLLALIKENEDPT